MTVAEIEEVIDYDLKDSDIEFDEDKVFHLYDNDGTYSVTFCGAKNVSRHPCFAPGKWTGEPKVCPICGTPICPVCDLLGGLRVEQVLKEEKRR